MTVSVGGDEGPGVLRVFSCVNLDEVMGLVRLAMEFGCLGGEDEWN